VEITDVRVFLIDDEKLKAFVSIVFDRCFMVNDIRVIQGRDGLFISMPSRKKRNGEFKDVAHPLNQEARSRIEGRVLAEYEAVRSGDAAIGGETEVAGTVAEPTAASGSEVAGSRLEEIERRHLDDAFWGVR
jgi:stage V sporulation protein G